MTRKYDYCDCNMEDNGMLYFLNIYRIYTGLDQPRSWLESPVFTHEQDRQIAKEYNRLYNYLRLNPSPEKDLDPTLSQAEQRIRRMMRYGRQSYYRIMRSLVVQGDQARPLYDRIVEAFEGNPNIEFEYPSKNGSVQDPDFFLKYSEKLLPGIIKV